MSLPSTQMFINITIRSLEYMATRSDPHLGNLQAKLSHKINTTACLPDWDLNLVRHWKQKILREGIVVNQKYPLWNYFTLTTHFNYFYTVVLVWNMSYVLNTVCLPSYRLSLQLSFILCTYWTKDDINVCRNMLPYKLL